MLCLLLHCYDSIKQTKANIKCNFQCLYGIQSDLIRFVVSNVITCACDYNTNNI